MKHLVEEELIGEVYGEGAAGAVRHLEECGECARAYADLKSDLAVLQPLELLDPPVRDAAYGERVWQAIADALPEYAPRRRRWLGLSLTQGPAQRLAYAAACALLVAGAFYAGRWWEHGKTQTTAQSKTLQTRRTPIVVVVLSDHLDRSERLLVELKHVDANNSDMMGPLRDEARSLLPANRICRTDAERTDDPALQSALDHLDHLLNELANQPEGLNAAAISRLKDEMNTDGLLFEVRVLRSRARDQKTEFANRSGGGTA